MCTWAAHEDLIEILVFMQHGVGQLAPTKNKR